MRTPRLELRPMVEDDLDALVELDGFEAVREVIDALEDQDDTDAVHANFDVDAEILERVAG